MGTLALPCPLCCTEKFSTSMDLKHHLLDIIDGLSCTGCGQQFVGIRALAEHIAYDCKVNSKECLEANDALTEVGEVSWMEGGVEVKLEEVREDSEDFQEQSETIIEDADSKIKIEEVEVSLGTQIKAEEKFFCFACNVHFENVDEHLNKFHRMGEVIFEDGRQTDNTSSEVFTPSVSATADTAQEEKSTSMKFQHPEFNLTNRTLVSDRQVDLNPNWKVATWKSGIGSFVCQYCNAPFSTYRLMVFHQRKHMSTETEVIESSDHDVMEEDIYGAPSSATLTLLKSKERYNKVYDKFVQWCEQKKFTNYSENVLLAFIREKSKENKCSTLWKTYSMLKTTLIVKNKIDIGKYRKVVALLKNMNRGYISKKSSIFSRKDFETFIFEAPDEVFLMMKVCMILGIAGACRREELSSMSIDNVQDVGSELIITVPDTDTKVHRSFRVVDKKINGTGILDVYRKYVNLRLPGTNHRRLLVFFDKKRQKCTTQGVGINTIGKIPSQIATYLKLPNPSSYTGHCFRKSSAAVLADNS